MMTTYLLLLKAPKPLRVRVGSLGLLSLPAGYYVYVGSARGPGGVKARVRRHWRLARAQAGRVRWHIDYLLVNPGVEFIESWGIENSVGMECEISKNIETVSASTVTGFGSSDCRFGCIGHLHHFEGDPRRRLSRLLAKLGLKAEKLRF